MKKISYSDFPLIFLFFALIMTIAFFQSGCSKDNEEIPASQCYVHLFDGENYKGDNIVVEGPGEFASLKQLPGTAKDWNDEADSFKSGNNTTVIFWTRTDFQGDSVIYEDGAKRASIDEPRSMKIICKN